MHVKCLITVFIIAAMPLCSQAQQRGNPDVPMPTMADAQRVIQIISGDRTKTQQYCKLVSLGEQIEQAGKRKGTKKVEKLFDKAVELSKKLGPEYATLMTGLEQLEQLEQASKEFLEISSVLAGLEKLCAKK